MKVYKQKYRVQGKLPHALGILISGGISLGLSGLPFVGVVMYFTIRKKVKADMAVLLKAPSNYRKSYKLHVIGKLLSKIALWLNIGMMLFWLTYLGVIFTYAVNHGVR